MFMFKNMLLFYEMFYVIYVSVFIRFIYLFLVIFKKKKKMCAYTTTWKWRYKTKRRGTKMYTIQRKMQRKYHKMQREWKMRKWNKMKDMKVEMHKMMKDGDLKNAKWNVRQKCYKNLPITQAQIKKRNKNEKWNYVHVSEPKNKR